MEATRLIPMHTIKNQSISYTVHERIDYAINDGKTLSGELVTIYSQTCRAQFCFLYSVGLVP